MTVQTRVLLADCITHHDAALKLMLVLISAQLALLSYMTAMHAGLHSHFRQSSRDGQHAASCPGSSEHGYSSRWAQVTSGEEGTE